MSKIPDINECEKVLIVEGYSDLHFYAEVLEYLNCFEGVFIKQFNGIFDLTLKLEAFLTPGLLAEKHSISILVDADDDAEARKRSIAAILKKQTHREIEHGAWSDGQPRLGFFVVPDGQNGGEVETLVWQAWSNDSTNASARSCIDEYLECMKSTGREAQSPDKGRISALLAVTNDEDPRLGPGARAKLFDFDSPEFKPLCDFLRHF
jgi:hypothetical protein